MNRKWLCVLLALCMAAAFLAGCGGNGSDTAQDQGSAAEGAGDAASAEGTAGAEGAGGGSAEKDVVFKFAFGQPLDGSDGRGYQYFAQCLEEESGGSVKLELYPASSLFSNSEILDALMNGTADIGHVTVSYMSPVIKELTPLELPGMYDPGRYMDFAYDLRDPIDAICNGYGLKILTCLVSCKMNFASVDSMIAGSPDMAGKNIRVSGVWIGKAVEAWGGNPATITLADVPTALERKTVDAVYGGCNTVIAPFKLYEMADNISFTSMQENLGFISMNLDSWNALSENQQKAMKRAINSWAVFTEQLMLDDEKNFRKALADNGNAVYDLTDAENEALRERSLALLDEAIAIAGPKGQELAEICESIRAKHGQPYTPGVIPEGYAE
ncbi:MAG: TRAP transporter substrate-binding protein [Clostridiales Family XIII bacterium]|jgi:TRAP-type C4-dicarboxylate transport system substrate-binding protein|nr:TRAP transporter substrate-binding protein [Clostridiales Family XIII bacterium]